MPATGNPYRAFPDTDLIDGVTSGIHSLRVRFRTAVHRTALTRALAEGANPAESDELALLARRLTSGRSREMFAGTLRRTIADAHLPASTRARVSIIDRRGVLNAEAAIVEMIERLVGPLPVQVRGMALLERILTNADCVSPLYNPSEPGTLRRMISGARAALDGQSAQSHEFVLAV